MSRRSLQHEAVLAGTGLFTQAACTVRIIPAKSNSGITFVRTDLPGKGPILAHASAISTVPVHPAFESLPPRHTNLQAHGTTVFTVEHILSALAGLGVTDALIELDGPEVPIFDGSAQPFVNVITEAGILDLDGVCVAIVVGESFTVRSGESWITVEPADEGVTYTYELDYGSEYSPDAPIGAQTATWTGQADTFVSQIAPARTFSLEHEAKAMQQLGLFTKFTPAELLVIGPAGPIDNHWRFDNEPARHKLLDLIGDLSLAGAPICAHITAHRSGHALNHDMAKHIASLAEAPRHRPSPRRKSGGPSRH